MLKLKSARPIHFTPTPRAEKQLTILRGQTNISRGAFARVATDYAAEKLANGEVVFVEHQILPVHR